MRNYDTVLCSLARSRCITVLRQMLWPYFLSSSGLTGGSRSPGIQCTWRSLPIMNEQCRNYRGPFLALLVLLFVSSQAFALSDHEKADLFSRAKETFREGNALRESKPALARQKYALAASLFERIAADGGVRNGKLYYNIGNARFLQDRIGRAILNYRRAEALMPRHADLKRNLAAARARRRDDISIEPGRKAMEILFFWHYDFSLFTRFVLFLIFFEALWVLGGASLWKRTLSVRTPVAACAVLAVVLGASIGVDEYARAVTREGVILAPEVVARKGDGEGYNSSFKAPLHEGTEFAIIEERGAWLHITLTDGRTCWIRRSSSAEVGEAGR